MNGCWSDQGSPGWSGVFGLPKAIRTASDSVVTGFHSAKALSTVGIVDVGTNVLAMNVIGNIVAKARPVTPSGVATALPRTTPTQIMAKAKANRSRYPPSASRTPDRIRHPMASPQIDMSVIGSNVL